MFALRGTGVLGAVLRRETGFWSLSKFVERIIFGCGSKVGPQNGTGWVNGSRLPAVWLLSFEPRSFVGAKQRVALLLPGRIFWHDKLSHPGLGFQIFWESQNPKTCLGHCLAIAPSSFCMFQDPSVSAWPKSPKAVELLFCLNRGLPMSAVNIKAIFGKTIFVH